MGLMESESADIFNAGINPDSLLQSARAFIRSIEATASGGDRDTIEKKLVDNLNSTLKTPVTRPTVNHPMVIIPRSLHMASHYASAPAEGLFSAVGEGGAAAASGACSGSFMGLLNEAGSIPPNLTEELINRKRITGIIESVVNSRSPRDLCEDFIRSEAALTAKERDEWKARTKNIKTPAADRKKEQSAHDREARLAKHVVESWTKYDKAKWKKERRRAKEG
jgi:hypothetical protein